MRIGFLGDIAFLNGYDKKSSSDAEKKLAFIKENLSDCDYIIGNLEAPFTEKDSTRVCKSMHLKSNPINVQLLQYLGIDAVSLANNHMFDYGYKGVSDTIDTLNSASIDWFGIDDKSITVEKNGEKLFLSGLNCYSTNGSHYSGKHHTTVLTEDNFRDCLKNAEKENSFPIIQVHWGIEHTNYPAYEHICMMRKLVSNKKCLVVGHHPHAVQGMQNINDSLVAYSLGNAIFDRCQSPHNGMVVELNDENRLGCLLKVDIIDGQITGSDCVGFKLDAVGITGYDIKDNLRKFSSLIEESANDIEKYGAVRINQYKSAVSAKFGKRDLSWLLHRLNYYSIGAKLNSKKWAKKYKEEIHDKFIDE